jgi:hypothetical protein
VLFALPVGYAVAASLANLVGTSHPYTGSALDVDARAFELGGPLYQDPARGHTAVTYTPLFPMLIAGLNRLLDWEGWGILVTVLAALALAFAAGLLAYRPGGARRLDRALALAGAAGVAALTWWLVSFAPFDFLFESRQDHLAWALGLGGLMATPLATARGSRPLGVTAALALIAAFMTKQTAAVAGLAALLWLAVALRRGAVSKGHAAVFVAALALLGCGSLALLIALTDGWAWRLAFELPAGHPRTTGLGASLKQLVSAAGAAAAIAAAFGLAAVWGRPRPRPQRRPATARGQVVLALLLFLAVGLPAAIWFDQKIGSLHNQFLGVIWALGLLAGAAWRAAQSSAPRSVACGFAVVAMFVVSEADVLQRPLERVSVEVPDKVGVASFQEVPAGLRRFASTEGLYHQVYSAINPRTVYPGHFSLDELLSGGYQSRFLLRAFFDRRFGAVYRFNDIDRGPSYASALGRFEENYHWKLNQVLQARYLPWRNPPGALADALDVPDHQYQSPGVLRRRPGAEREAWMRRCFGPFAAGGVSWRIRAGGGFWCRSARSDGAISLRRTPAPWSEIVAEESVPWPQGRLVVHLPVVDGAFRVSCGAFGLLGRLSDPRTLKLSAGMGARRARARLRPRREGITIDFTTSPQPSLTAGGSNAVAGAPRQQDCTPSIEASRRSGAVVEPVGLAGR